MTIKGYYIHPQVAAERVILFDLIDVVCYNSRCCTKY